MSYGFGPVMFNAFVQGAVLPGGVYMPLINRQHNLAEIGVGFHISVSFRDLFQWE